LNTEVQLFVCRCEIENNKCFHNYCFLFFLLLVEGVGLFISLHNPILAVWGYAWSSDCELNHKVPVMCIVLIYRETISARCSLFVLVCYCRRNVFACLSVSALFSKMIETV